MLDDDQGGAMALADLIKDLEKKTTDAKTRVTGAIAFLKDKKKVQGAGLYDKKKMSGFIGLVNETLGRAKDARDTILQNKDYKAITDAKDPIKVRFTKVNEELTKRVQTEFGNLRKTASEIEAAEDPRRVALEAQKNALAKIDDAGKAYADKAIWKEVAEFSKSVHAVENFRFIAFLDAGNLAAAYKMVTDDELNINGKAADAIKAKPKDAASYKLARAEIMKNADDTAAKWRNAKVAKINEALKKLGG